jgi:hypothetical protein
MKDREQKIISPEIAPDMKLYFSAMLDVLRYQGNSLSLAGMDAGRSGIDIVRELLRDSILRIGKLNVDSFGDIELGGWQKVYRRTKMEMKRGDIIPKSKLPEQHQELFQDLRTLYFFAMEEVNRKRGDGLSYKNGLIGIPVKLIIEMLDKIVDVNSARKKWEEIRADKDKFRDFFATTKWRVDDLLRI